MKVLLLLLALALTISCGGTETVEVVGLDGKDGTNGENGENGKDGSDGAAGKDGVDGVNSTMLSELYCSGELVGGNWGGVTYMWSMTTFKTGDVFVVASTMGTSVSSFYSGGEVEADTGYIKTPGSSQWAEISYDPSTEKVTANFSNTSFSTAYDVTGDCTLTAF